jgi:hypothetical protein
MAPKFQFAFGPDESFFFYSPRKNILSVQTGLHAEVVEIGGS